MDSQRIDEILDYLVNDLGGDWFLTGGALVRIAFDPERGTEDVDFVRVRHPTLSDEASRNQLFQWLIARGLGPEWVNPAVEPFVREVPLWESETVLLRHGSKGTVLRPNLTLFVYLKLRRGTEVDLRDIQVAKPLCAEGFDEKKLRRWASPSVLQRFELHRGRLGF